MTDKRQHLNASDEITSIGQALALLGVENLKRWATLTVLASVDGSRPS